MIKAKWLYSKLPLSLRQLSKLMKEEQYSDASGCGFLLSTSTDSKLVGKYIEKMTLKTVVEDPFGNISEVETVSYYTCHFNWSSESNYMFVLEPPRSLRKFINRIHNLTGFGIVFSEVNVSPQLWLELIEREADLVRVFQISASGIKAASDASASFVVTGKSDVKKAFFDLIGDKRYLVDSVKFEAYFDEITIKGELTKFGVSRVKSTNSTFVLEKLRESLAQSSTQNK
ncbi:MULTISPECIES: hypothetical protein [Vibrio harveyi group]|uniref:hypothetical protein n=1 Tax=Vibrio harveyi group TaxID=717610 RepID=UPI001A296E81|nr:MULTISPECIES: hypothetical protein [Vibrio harveyi group]MCS0435131.1 hypothetical protein [Vibrio diabolicus]HAS6505041.1 hypothetical protein [Vibrio parahaemolyticus]